MAHWRGGPRCQPRALLLTAPHSGPAGQHVQANAQAGNPAGSIGKYREESGFFPMNSAVLNFLSAAAPAAQEPPAWLQFMPLVAMAVIFWFLILRPQMRQQKEQRTKIEGIKKGDQVMTGGGLVGKVIKVDDQYAEIELAPNVRVKAVKSTISDVVDPMASAAAND